MYPPEKQLPLKYKDLLSFCFPGGLEVELMPDYFFTYHSLVFVV